MAITHCNCPLSPAPLVESTTSLTAVCGGPQFLLFMGVLEAFLRTQCDIADPCRRPRSDTSPPYDQTFDFIVVGAGAAGAAVAGRLSAHRDRHSVLLVEAGGHEPIGLQVPAFALLYTNKDDHFQWLYQIHQNNRSLMSGRSGICALARLLGGCTANNAMIYLRGTRSDFDRWARLGNRGWSYDEVLPFFLRAEDHRDIDQVDRRYHATGGPVAVSRKYIRSQKSIDFMRAAVECGLAETDLNGANSTGAMFSQTTTLDGVRCSTSRAYLHPAWNRRNLQVRMHTQVTRVLIDPNTKRAYGVEAVDRDGRRWRWFARKEVIVSGGPLESPKLLLHSGIGPAAHLRRIGVRPIVDRPGVGHNLQNHVVLRLQAVSTTRNQTTINWAMATEYLLERSGPLSQLGQQQLQMRFSSAAALASGDGEDVQLMLLDGFYSPPELCSQTGAIDVDHQPPMTLYGLSILLRPQSRGWLQLASTDPLLPPEIWANELSVEADVDAILAGVRKLLQIIASDALAGYGFELQRSGGEVCNGFGLQSAEYWRCVLRQESTGYAHYSGTCKMAPAGDRNRVVDADLRVYGVKGLRVIDASVMPILVAANTMATTTMIGEKGAQSILDAWAK